MLKPSTIRAYVGARVSILGATSLSARPQIAKDIRRARAGMFAASYQSRWALLETARVSTNTRNALKSQAGA